jgi:hypothetical protein
MHSPKSPTCFIRAFIHAAGIHVDAKCRRWALLCHCHITVFRVASLHEESLQSPHINVTPVNGSKVGRKSTFLSQVEHHRRCL